MRSLIYHIYGDGNIETIAYNLAYLRSYIHHFDQKIIKIHTNGPENFIKVSSMIDDLKCTVKSYPNAPALGEYIGFEECLNEVRIVNPTGLLFYGEAKGVSRKGDDLLKNIKAWAKVMYTLCLSNINKIEDILYNKGYYTYGCLKKSEPMHKGGHRPSPWHYSGNFYWLRNDILFSRNWRELAHARHVTELYPGYVFNTSEAYCAFNTTKDLYLEELKEIDWYRAI